MKANKEGRRYINHIEELEQIISTNLTTLVFYNIDCDHCNKINQKFINSSSLFQPFNCNSDVKCIQIYNDALIKDYGYFQIGKNSIYQRVDLKWKVINEDEFFASIKNDSLLFGTCNRYFIDIIKELYDRLFKTTKISTLCNHYWHRITFIKDNLTKPAIKN
jgi:hypothetical protein